MRIGVGVLALTFMLAAAPAFAAPASYQYNGITYYVVDGNSQDLNSGDRVCQSMGLTCVGYTAHTTAVCQYFHPSASVNSSSVNGTNSGFYCNGAPQGYAACSTAKNNCQMCPGCGGVSCSDQIGDQYAEMYVQCASTSTAPATPSLTSASTSNSANWLQNFLNWLHGLWLSLGWITPSGQPTGANHPAQSAPVQGTRTPGQQCDNGGECKSGNCVQDPQGVYRCSCSPLGLDYSC